MAACSEEILTEEVVKGEDDASVIVLMGKNGLFHDISIAVHKGVYPAFLLLFVPVAHADPGVVLIFLKKQELDRSAVFSNGIGSCLSYP